jgi:hypothetical protein
MANSKFKCSNAKRPNIRPVVFLDKENKSTTILTVINKKKSTTVDISNKVTRYT